MRKPLVIDTKRGLYKPIEVVIDGKTYRVKRITRPVIIELDSLAKKALEGDVEAAYKQLTLLFGKHKELDELDIREVSEVVTYVTTEIFQSEKVETQDTEKNVKSPGDKKSR